MSQIVKIEGNQRCEFRLLFFYFSHELNILKPFCECKGQNVDVLSKVYIVYLKVERC